jgi:hypothetical protein
MVQAAAQAQAVVAAAKTRGDGLVPMNQSQIHALSQIQAQAIVHARKSQGTPQQIQTQIQLQGTYSTRSLVAYVYAYEYAYAYDPIWNDVCMHMLYLCEGPKERQDETEEDEVEELYRVSLSEQTQHDRQ